MSPIQKLTACTWPGCEHPPSGAFCGRDRKRMIALGFSARKAELPDAETIERLPELWMQHTAQSDVRAPAPVVEPAAESARVAELEAEVEKLRGQLENMTTLRDAHVGVIREVMAALGPKHPPIEGSIASAVQNLHRYVREVEQEGGHYALLCQQAHDELDRAGARSINNMGAGTPAERIRLLVADHTASRPTDMVQTQPKHHPWLDEVTAGSLVLTPRDVKIAKLSIDALADDNDMTDITFIADVLRVVLHLDDVPRG